MEAFKPSYPQKLILWTRPENTTGVPLLPVDDDSGGRLFVRGLCCYGIGREKSHPNNPTMRYLPSALAAYAPSGQNPFVAMLFSSP